MHNPEIISIEPLSDGAITICVRCCGDPSTDSIHKQHFTADTDLAEVQTKIEAHKTRVADLHAANQKIKDFLSGINATS
jgi:hypothetical protein